MVETHNPISHRLDERPSIAQQAYLLILPKRMKETSFDSFEIISSKQNRIGITK